MKSKTLIALAVASSFACAGALAGGGGHHSRVEVQTPASVSESAPWLTGPLHQSGWSSHAGNRIGFQEGQFSDGPVGTSSSAAGIGSIGYDSTGSTDDMSISNARTIDSGDSVTRTEYWLLDSDPGSVGASSSESGAGSVGFDSMSRRDDVSFDHANATDSNGLVAIIHYQPIDSDTPATGMSSGAGGSGSVGFDSSMSGSDTADFNPMNESSFGDRSLDSAQTSGEPLAFVQTSAAEQIASTIGEVTPLLSEHYLVRGPLSQADPESMIKLEIGPASRDVALLDALSRDFFVLTPAYDEG